eukprot:SAG31_NODE_338_length_17490_cov_7.707032_17_plen_96_part_00
MFGRFGRFEAVAGPRLGLATLGLAALGLALLGLAALGLATTGNQPAAIAATRRHLPISPPSPNLPDSAGFFSRVGLGVGSCARGSAQEVAARIAQ